MAIEWREGFELGSMAAIAARYQSVTAEFTAISTIDTGRTGAQSVKLRSGAFTFRRPVARAEIIVNIAYKQGSFGVGTDFIKLLDSAGGRQATLRITSSGTFELYRGNPVAAGTLLATSAAISVGFYVNIELKYIVSDTVGAYELRLNEVSQFSGSGVDTKETSNANILDVTINGLEIDSTTPAANFVDDYIVANLSQPIPASGFYGNIRVETIWPNAVGTVTGFTPFGNASNWDNVNDNPHNSDTDYNYSSTVNASDLYGMTNMSSPNATNMGVQVTYVARKDDALTRVTAPLIRSGGVTYPGENDSLTTSYAYYTEQWNFNPNTSDYFSISEINAIEVGLTIKT